MEDRYTRGERYQGRDREVGGEHPALREQRRQGGGEEKGGRYLASLQHGWPHPDPPALPPPAPPPSASRSAPPQIYGAAGAAVPLEEGGRWTLEKIQEEFKAGRSIEGKVEEATRRNIFRRELEKRLTDGEGGGRGRMRGEGGACGGWEPAHPPSSLVTLEARLHRPLRPLAPAAALPLCDSQPPSSTSSSSLPPPCCPSQALATWTPSTCCSSCRRCSRCRPARRAS